MKHFSFALLLMAMLAFVMVGCSDNPAPISPPTNEALVTPAANAPLAKKGPFIHSVSASCHVFVWDTPEEEGFYDKQFCIIEACQYAGDTFSGRLFVKSITSDQRIEGEVIKLIVDQNMAKVEVVVTESTMPVVGAHFFITLIDNGEGLGKGERDQATCAWMVPAGDPFLTALQGMSPEQFIEFVNGLPLGFPAVVPLDAGNIQVR